MNSKSDGLAGSNDGGAGEVDNPIEDDALEEEDLDEDSDEFGNDSISDTEQQSESMFTEDDFIQS